LTRTLSYIASASLIALILLCLAWELWLAPLRPGGSWLVLKAVILLVPLRGILKGRRYTYQWMSMFILLYFIEGVMRAWSDHGLSARLAMGEIALSLSFFGAAIFYAKYSAPSRMMRKSATADQT
jgi:uncharacterized membrane protein